MLKNVFLLGCSSLVLLAGNNENAGTPKKQADDITSTTTAMHNALTKDETREGWQLLFDGVSTKGWHTYGNKPVGKVWKVADSTLYLEVSKTGNRQISDGGDLITDHEYDNFELKLEWKIETAGNSGILFYVHEDSAKYKRPWQTGLEMQVLDNDGHADAKINKHRAGDLYDLVACSKETVRPALQWNQVRIKAVNGKLDLYQNDEHVVSTNLWDDNWKKMVAGSKFKTMPGFGIYKKGKIGLQDHGDNVWFRNIKIRRL